MIRLKKNVALLGALALLFACEKTQVESFKPVDDSPLFRNFPNGTSSKGRSASGNFKVYTAEYLATEESGQAGRIVYLNDVGNKQLSADFVPGLSLDGTDNVSYYVDQNRPSADLPVAVSSAAIDRAMWTWDGVTCSNLGMTKVASNPAVTTGFIAAILGFDGSFDYTADVVHSGWLPGSFFDFVAEDGSQFILGVTFTIIFTDDLGNPVDTNGDGKLDVAWREIYYNDAFTWRDGNHYDVETIALHESGHGLSQAHFGKAFANNSGKIHFAPRAVMNAAYSGIQTRIGGSDLAGHCSNWANWPNN